MHTKLVKLVLVSISGLSVCLWLSPLSGQNTDRSQQFDLLQRNYRRVVEENERLKQVLDATRTELTTLKGTLQHPEQALKVRDAIQRLSQAIEAKPDEAGLYKNRGIAHRHLGEYSRSIQDLTKAIQLKATEASFYNERGTAYFLERKLDRARKDFSRAIALDSKLAEAYHNRGVIAHKEGDYIGAARDLRKAQNLGIEQAAPTLEAVMAEVTAIQRRLDQLGLAPGPVDGRAGAKTVAAIRRLQKSAGLEPTGRVDVATRTVLRTGQLPPQQVSSTANPRLLGKPELKYPAMARERGWEGVVRLRIELLKNGRVGAVEVAKSSGHPVLDEAAVESVKRWRHQPAVENGVAVTRNISFDIEFALDKKETP